MGVSGRIQRDSAQFVIKLHNQTNISVALVLGFIKIKLNFYCIHACRDAQRNPAGGKLRYGTHLLYSLPTRNRMSMLTIGLIGGITWESTLDYYRVINREVARRLGGVHSARLAMVSLDFQAVRDHTLAGDEPAVLAMFVEAAHALERAGAGSLVLCANTAHRRAEALTQSCALPLVHIGDAVGRALHRAGVERVGLLGTAATMEEPFMRDYLERGYGLSVSVPGESNRAGLDALIFGEMARGIFSDAGRRATHESIAELAAGGAQAVILGCTELPILMRDEVAACPMFDSTELHALAAVEHALSPNPNQ